MWCASTEDQFYKRTNVSFSAAVCSHVKAFFPLARPLGPMFSIAFLCSDHATSKLNTCRTNHYHNHCAPYLSGHFSLYRLILVHLSYSVSLLLISCLSRNLPFSLHLLSSTFPARTFRLGRPPSSRRTIHITITMLGVRIYGRTSRRRR